MSMYSVTVAKAVYTRRLHCGQTMARSLDCRGDLGSTIKAALHTRFDSVAFVTTVDTFDIKSLYAVCTLYDFVLSYELVLTA